MSHGQNGYYDNTAGTATEGVTTTYEYNADNKVIAERVDTLREAIAGNRDEWAMRFSGVEVR